MTESCVLSFVNPMAISFVLKHLPKTALMNNYCAGAF